MFLQKKQKVLSLTLAHVSFYYWNLQSADSKESALRGVMRVGLVAKGLLLKGDKDLELVLLSSNKPTVTLLSEVAEKLSAQLEVQEVFWIIFSYEKNLSFHFSCVVLCYSSF